MRNWENYGDVNFFEYGGVLLDVDKEINENMDFPCFCVYALKLDIFDTTRVLQTSYIDVLDYDSYIDVLCAYTGENPKEIKKAFDEYRSGIYDEVTLNVLKRYAVDVVDNLTVYEQRYDYIHEAALETHEILKSYGVPDEWNGAYEIRVLH